MPMADALAIDGLRIADARVEHGIEDVGDDVE
jgi:hypothetical protein